MKDARTHRYRHTFITDKLANGGSYADVGRMVGDSAATIEKHYAEFSREWQERLRRFVEEPQPVHGQERAQFGHSERNVN